MKKTSMFVLTMLVGALCISGCSQKNEVSDIAKNASTSDTVSILTKTSPDDKLKTESAEDIAEAFVKALHDKDYKTALSLLDVNSSNNFVTADGLEDAIKQSDVYSKKQDITKLDVNNLVVSRDQTSPDVVTFVFSDRKSPDIHYSVDTSLDPISNEWKVFASGLYTEQFSFTAPNDVPVYVDGNKVSEDLIDVENLGDAGMFCRYTLPYVNETAKIKLDYGSFDYETKLDTKSNNAITGSVPMIYKTVPENKRQEYCDDIKDNWNALSKELSKSSSDIDFNKYISKDATDTVFADITTTILHDNKLNHDFKITKLEYTGDDNYYLDGDVVYAKFGYMLEWKDSDGYMRSMRRMSDVVVKKEDGKWRFLFNSDAKFFSYFDVKVREW